MSLPLVPRCRTLSSEPLSPKFPGWARSPAICLEDCIIGPHEPSVRTGKLGSFGKIQDLSTLEKAQLDIRRTWVQILLWSLAGSVTLVRGYSRDSQSVKMEGALSKAITCAPSFNPPRWAVSVLQKEVAEAQRRGGTCPESLSREGQKPRFEPGSPISKAAT